MSNLWTVRTLEISGLAAAWLAAAGAAAWVRRPLARRASGASRAVARWLCALSAAAAFPLLAMGIGWVVLALP